MTTRNPTAVPDLPDLSWATAGLDSVVRAATPYGEEPTDRAWRDILWRAAFTMLGGTPGVANTIRDRISAHVSAETGYAPDDPRCEAHPFVATILAVTSLTHDGSAALRTVIASPEWVDVHGVRFGPHGELIPDVWAPHAPVVAPVPPAVPRKPW